MISWQVGALCLAAAAEAAYAFAPAHAPSVRAAPLRMSSSNAPSRRDFLSVSVASATLLGLAGSAMAENGGSGAKVLNMEMDLEAPSLEEDTARIKREFKKMKDQESKASTKPRWQQDLEKQKGKKAQAKKDLKNRDELCEVLGRGC